MMGSFLRDFLRIHPARGEWTVAIRAALSVLLPLLALWATGRLEWAMYASFGALSSIFGRTLPLPQRLRAQGEAGFTLVAAILIGVTVALSPVREWVLIPVAAVFATGMAVVAHRRNWHPPGVLFQVFALGACASTPHVVADLAPAALVSIAALALSLALTYLTSLARHLWRRRAGRATPAWPRQTPAPGTLPGDGPEWPLRHYVVRYAVGIALAGVLATAVGVGHPYWAIVSVVVPMAAPTAAARTLRGVQRVVGTLAGVLVTWVLLSFSPSPLALILIVTAMQVGAELFVGRNYTVSLLFITPLALCMVQLGHPLPVAQLVSDRAIETVLGVAVALALTLVTRERRQRGDAD
ncbi:FUSC family protein [Microbacterium oryzae]|uniref:FUSC family protein n=1 Tax=Microbacterium oryzae TaxID=743009 RepID=A0A6I6E8L4_9MICO|nr:FUSC family protein [Microbacterium oryzae]QGU27951.1 FUSC family protein [Microbacterium oryzae]